MFHELEKTKPWWCWGPRWATPKYATVAYWLFWINVAWETADTRKKLWPTSVPLKAGNKSPVWNKGAVLISKDSVNMCAQLCPTLVTRQAPLSWEFSRQEYLSELPSPGDFLVQFSCLVMSDSLRPHEPQHARPPCLLPTPGVHPNPCALSRWCHPTISSSVVPFSSCPASFPASGSFPMSQLFSSGGQSIGVSASTSVLPMNIQDWSPLGWTGWIPLQSRRLSGVFSNTTVQQHQFFGTQLSL